MCCIQRRSKVKKTFLTSTILALVIGVLAGAIFSVRPGASAAANGQRVIHVVEHAVTDTVQEFHPPNMSLGDVLGFHNPVFDAGDKHRVGTDNGDCVRTVASGKTEWECFWTVILSQGQITVEGPYYDDGTDTLLAITGGTGAFLGAQGQMKLHARGNPVGSEYDFVYLLVH
jgi:allene oxide cyclase